jgi:hypothetical protein
MSACGSPQSRGPKPGCVARYRALVSFKVSLLGGVDQSLAEVGLGQESLARRSEGLGVVSQQKMDPIFDLEALTPMVVDTTGTR